MLKYDLVGLAGPDTRTSYTALGRAWVHCEGVLNLHSRIDDAVLQTAQQHIAQLDLYNVYP